MNSDIIEFNNCLICGSQVLKPLDRYKSNYLCKCSDCGFIFSKKKPTPKELEIYYKNYGSNDYISPVTIKRYHELLDIFESYRKNGRILDVGCGKGYFLEEAKKRGWDVYGTEFNSRNERLLIQKGIKTISGKLKSHSFEKASFDIITSFEVIEHINNPTEEISIFHNLLREGGALYITTPNFNALERFYLKEKYNIINYPEHLSYYTKKSLHFLLNKQGFKKLKSNTTGISLTRIKTSKKTSSEKIVEKDNSDDKLRTLTEENRLANVAKYTINWGLNFLGVGNALKVLYIKN